MVRNEYSKPLAELYEDGRKFCDNFEKAVDFLVTDTSGLKQDTDKGDIFGISSINRNLLTKTNIRDWDDPEFNRALMALRTHYQEWHTKVLKILKKIPQASFMLRIEHPKISINPYSSIYEYTRAMERLLEEYYCFDGEVNELFGIIDDYEKSIYQPSDFAEIQINNVDNGKKNIIYCFRYDQMQGKLFVNDVEVGKCNLGSKLDQALSQAVDIPNKPIKTKGSLASAIANDNIKLPKDLKKLMFRTSKNSFVLNPEITLDDVRNAGLDIDKINQELQAC